MNTIADVASGEFGRALLTEKFAPWVQQLRLSVESTQPTVLRLSNHPDFTRIGGIICGQALMAAADTAMVLAVAENLGGFVEMATVSMTTSFFAPAKDEDVLVRVTLNKVGRSLAFGDVHMLGAASQRLCAQATLTYSVAARK